MTSRYQEVRTSLHQNSYLNWALIATVVLIVAISVLSIIPPLISNNLANFWLFSKPQMLLITVLTLTLVTLAGLAHQRRYLNSLRQEFSRSRIAEREQARRHTARVYALLNVSRMMVSQNDLETVFKSVAEMCVDVFGCDQSSLMLFDADSGELGVRAVGGGAVDPDILGASQKIGEGVAGWVAQNRKPLLLTRTDAPAAHPGLKLTNENITSAMVVPIILRDELVGVLNVSGRTTGIDFDDDDLHALMVFAENVGTCIRHTEQAEWMRATIRHLQSKADAATNV